MRSKIENYRMLKKMLPREWWDYIAQSLERYKEMVIAEKASLANYAHPSELMVKSPQIEMEIWVMEHN